MSNKITKESVVKTEKPTEVKKVETVSKGKSTPEIVKEDTTIRLSSLSSADKELLKKELLGEVMAEAHTIEISFQKTKVKGSRECADRLNARPKRMAVWPTVEGEKQGYVEEVKINGAVAQIPKGVSVLVPESVAKMIEGKLFAEKTAGNTIENQQGGQGVRADRDETTKERLGLK